MFSHILQMRWIVISVLRIRVCIFLLATCFAVAVTAQTTAPEKPNSLNMLGKLLQQNGNANRANDTTPNTQSPTTTEDTANRVLNGNSFDSAAPRLALVIGNAAYSGAGELKNPVNDATDMAAKLKTLRFDVTVKTDMTHKGMLRALTEFGDKIKPGSEVLFYYAGHGMQVRGKNYLIPVDAEIRTESSVSSEAVDVDQLFDKLAPARLSMVLLDACRNNPFERRFRGGGQGLTQMNAPTGTLIAYATAPGKVASDGEGRNGLYTQEILKALDVPGITVEEVFKRVRANVVKKSSDAQTPWESSSLTGDFYFRPVSIKTMVATQEKTANQIEDELWQTIKDSGHAPFFEEYLKDYPKGRYATQARVTLAKIKPSVVTSTVVSTPIPAPLPVVQNSTATDPDTALWNAVEKGGTEEDYDVYIKQNPKGKYVALAKQRVQKLKDQALKAAQAQEQSAWEQAQGSATVAGYNSYLSSYAKGKYVALAQARIEKIKKDQAEQEKQQAVLAQLEAQRLQREQQQAAIMQEDEAWSKVQNAQDSVTVNNYLRNYPQGRYVEVAQSKLEEIKKKEAELLPGKVFKDCQDCPEMVVLPAGGFMMGSTAQEQARAQSQGLTKKFTNRENPHHYVTISRFAIGKTEVTKAQYAAFVTATSHNSGYRCEVLVEDGWKYTTGLNWQNPGYSQSDIDPVACVNWNDAQAYAKWLSSKTGQQYRLPSEAEWEYACRGGVNQTYCGSNNVDAVAVYVKNSGNRTQPVMSKQPNGFGLYDMSGNLWEWTQDCWNESYYGAPANHAAWTTGDCERRVNRGGSWRDEAIVTRSAIRGRLDAENRSFGDGFRLARMLH